MVSSPRPAFCKWTLHREGGGGKSNAAFASHFRSVESRPRTQHDCRNDSFHGLEPSPCVLQMDITPGGWRREVECGVRVAFPICRESPPHSARLPQRFVSWSRALALRFANGHHTGRVEEGSRMRRSRRISDL